MKKTKEADPWKDTTTHILWGVGLAILVLLGLLLLGAVAISKGWVMNTPHIVYTSCLIATMAGGWLAITKEKGRALPMGLGVGISLYLLFVVVGTLGFPSFSLANGGLELGLACLVGGAFVGLLKIKKRR
ncbi:MAG: TIGR04086 family membrane protein [Eubacteriales bacterium]